jgi:adenine-specific DNA-methyltransferase
MIKSENWQALNLLQERYQGMVKCIYIDPPYNTGNDDFIYKDGYQNSSWLSLIRDRLKLAGKFLSRAGSHASTIDKNEDAFLRLVHDDVFGEKNFIATIAWQKLYTIKNSAKYLSEMYDSIIIYSRDIENWLPNLIPRSEDQDEVYGNPDNDPNGPWISNALQARNYYGSGKYSIQCPGGRFIEGPPQGTYWRLSEANFKELDRQGRVWWGKNKNSFPRIKKYLKEIKEGVVPVDFWLHQFAGTNAESKTETRQLIGSDVEGLTPKPVLLLKRLVSMNADKDSIIMDYFAGSGTTAQAILDLNYDDNGMRKYILIEMGEFFDTVMKPRIEKVMYSKDWKDGRPSSCNGASHMFKYIYMEQYEDTLNNIEFLDSNKSVQKTLKDLDGYFLRYMLDFETRGSSCRLNVDQLSQPFKYTLNITRNNETRDEAVDLVETFNYLLGLSIKRIKAFNNNGSYYKAVLGTKGEETAAIIWRSIEGLDLEVDKEFIENYILKDFKANKVYVNSDCFVEGVIPIEPEFKRLMGA